MYRWSAFILILAVHPSLASKDGFYLGIGLSSNEFRGIGNDQLFEIIEDKRATGWRAEFGHIWDIGKVGGLQLGVSGAYDDLGKVKSRGSTAPFANTEATFKESAFSAYFVIDQVIAPWIDFLFRVGPSVIRYDAELCCDSSALPVSGEERTKMGAASTVGFAFFPSKSVAIELSAQGFTWWDDEFKTDKTDGEGDEETDAEDDQLRGLAISLAASVQYRF